MFKGLITNHVTVANTNVPIEVEFNTNDKISYSASKNTIIFDKTGYYDIKTSLTVTGVAGDVTVQLFADGVAVQDAIAQSTLADAGDYESLSIVDAIKVVRDTYPNAANISMRFTTSGIIVNGIVIAEFVR